MPSRPALTSVDPNIKIPKLKQPKGLVKKDNAKALNPFSAIIGDDVASSVSNSSSTIAAQLDCSTSSSKSIHSLATAPSKPNQDIENVPALTLPPAALPSSSCPSTSSILTAASASPSSASSSLLDELAVIVQGQPNPYRALDIIEQLRSLIVKQAQKNKSTSQNLIQHLEKTSTSTLTSTSTDQSNRRISFVFGDDVDDESDVNTTATTVVVGCSDDGDTICNSSAITSNSDNSSLDFSRTSILLDGRISIGDVSDIIGDVGLGVSTAADVNEERIPIKSPSLPSSSSSTSTSATTTSPSSSSLLGHPHPHALPSSIHDPEPPSPPPVINQTQLKGKRLINAGQASLLPIHDSNDMVIDASASTSTSVSANASDAKSKTTKRKKRGGGMSQVEAEAAREGEREREENALESLETNNKIPIIEASSVASPRDTMNDANGLNIHINNNAVSLQEHAYYYPISASNGATHTQMQTIPISVIEKALSTSTSTSSYLTNGGDTSLRSSLQLYVSVLLYWAMGNESDSLQEMKVGREGGKEERVCACGVEALCDYIKGIPVELIASSIMNCNSSTSSSSSSSSSSSLSSSSSSSMPMVSPQKRDRRVKIQAVSPPNDRRPSSLSHTLQHARDLNNILHTMNTCYDRLCAFKCECHCKYESQDEIMNTKPHSITTNNNNTGRGKSLIRLLGSILGGLSTTDTLYSLASIFHSVAIKNTNASTSHDQFNALQRQHLVSLNRLSRFLYHQLHSLSDTGIDTLVKDVSDAPTLSSTVQWVLSSVIRSRMRFLYDAPPPQISTPGPAGLKGEGEWRKGNIHKELLLSKSITPLCACLDRKECMSGKKKRKVDNNNKNPHTFVPTHEVPLSTLISYALRQMNHLFLIVHAHHKMFTPSMSSSYSDILYCLVCNNNQETSSETSGMSGMSGMSSNDLQRKQLDIVLEKVSEWIKCEYNSGDEIRKDSSFKVLVAAEQGRLFLQNLFSKKSIQRINQSSVEEWDNVKECAKMILDIPSSSSHDSSSFPSEWEHCGLLAGGWQGLLTMQQSLIPEHAQALLPSTAVLADGVVCERLREWEADGYVFDFPLLLETTI